MSADVDYPVQTQLVLIRRDIEDIRVALWGDGKGRGGLIDRVEDLADVAQRGQWSLKVALWLGGGVVAVATGIAQLKTAVVGLFGGHL